MRKGLLKSEKMGDYEKEQGFASYRTIIEYFVGDIVLCNNIAEVDESVYENMSFQPETKYYNENDEEITEEEYFEDENAYFEEEDYPEIFQWYLCNLTQYEKEQLEEMGIILSYSDKLDCDVLCVDHWGTGWDYVLTNVKLFDTYEELEKYEKGEK